jgi:alanine racemase
MGPTVAYISHSNFQYNIELIREAIGSRKIMAVVKANAYGHGDLEISKTAIESGCEYLGVAFVEEGIKLRKSGISHPILVFGAHHSDSLKSAIDSNLEITITSEEQIAYLKEVSLRGQKISIHLKIDTGMNRVGFPLDSFEKSFQNILNNRMFNIKGIYSHLSSADESDHAYTNLQISRFKEIKAFVESNCSNDIRFHLANSAAIMKYPEAYFDMVRPGIMLYGQPPSPDFKLEWDLKEVLSFRSKLVLIKYLKKNEPVSYSRRFYTKDATHVGVIPAGYADGLNRGLTNSANVIIRGEKYPLVGTICMDMVMVDLGESLKCNVGDEVIFYGGDTDKRISIREVSAQLKTIPYEITCNVSARVPRNHLYSQLGGKQ